MPLLRWRTVLRLGAPSGLAISVSTVTEPHAANTPALVSNARRAKHGEDVGRHDPGCCRGTDLVRVDSSRGTSDGFDRDVHVRSSNVAASGNACDLDRTASSALRLAGIGASTYGCRWHRGPRGATARMRCQPGAVPPHGQACSMGGGHHDESIQTMPSRVEARRGRNPVPRSTSAVCHSLDQFARVRNS